MTPMGVIFRSAFTDYTYKTNPVSFSFAPDLPAQSIFGRRIKPTVSESSRALIVSGEP